MSAFFVLWEIKSSGLGFFFITGSSAESCGGYGAAAGLHIALIILQNYKNSYLKQRLTNEI